MKSKSKKSTTFAICLFSKTYTFVSLSDSKQTMIISII